MPWNVYRGDARRPEELVNGFEARVALSSAQAKALVARCDGASTQGMTVPLPDLCAELKNCIETTMKGKKIDLGSLGREIKKEKSQTTVHNSTDVTQSCGGYGGTIYKIEFETLYQKRNGGWQQPANPIQASRVAPSLVLDTQGMSDATTVVAVAIYGVAEREGQEQTTEVAFLTSIPRANILQYSDDAGVTWNDMPT